MNAKIPTIIVVALILIVSASPYVAETRGYTYTDATPLYTVTHYGVVWRFYSDRVEVYDPSTNESIVFESYILNSKLGKLVTEFKFTTVDNKVIYEYKLSKNILFKTISFTIRHIWMFGETPAVKLRTEIESNINIPSQLSSIFSYKIKFNLKNIKELSHRVHGKRLFFDWHDMIKHKIPFTTTKNINEISLEISMSGNKIVIDPIIGYSEGNATTYMYLYANSFEDTILNSTFATWTGTADYGVIAEDTIIYSYSPYDYFKSPPTNYGVHMAYASASAVGSGYNSVSKDVYLIIEFNTPVNGTFYARLKGFCYVSWEEYTLINYGSCSYTAKLSYVNSSGSTIVLYTISDFGYEASVYKTKDTGWIKFSVTNAVKIMINISVSGDGTVEEEPTGAIAYGAGIGSAGVFIDGLEFNPTIISGHYWSYSDANTTYAFYVQAPVNGSVYVLIPKGFDILNVTQTENGTAVPYSTQEYNSTHYILIFDGVATYNYTIYAHAWNAVYDLYTDYTYYPHNAIIPVYAVLKDPYGNPITSQDCYFYLIRSDTNSTVQYIAGTPSSDGTVTVYANLLDADMKYFIQAETNGTYAGLKYITVYSTNLNISYSIPNTITHLYLYEGAIPVSVSVYHTVDSTPASYMMRVNNNVYSFVGDGSVNVTVPDSFAGPYPVNLTVDYGAFGTIINVTQNVDVYMAYGDFKFYSSNPRNITNLGYDSTERKLWFTTTDTVVDITVPSDLGKPSHVYLDGSEIFEGQYWWWDEALNVLRIYVPYSNIEVYWAKPTTTTTTAVPGVMIFLPIATEKEETVTTTTTVYVFNATAVTQVIVVDNQTYTITLWIHKPPHGLAEQLYSIPVYMKIGVMLLTMSSAIILVIFLLRKE